MEPPIPESLLYSLVCMIAPNLGSLLHFKIPAASSDLPSLQRMTKRFFSGRGQAHLLLSVSPPYTTHNGCHSSDIWTEHNILRTLVVHHQLLMAYYQQPLSPQGRYKEDQHEDPYYADRPHRQTLSVRDHGRDRDRDRDLRDRHRSHRSSYSPAYRGDSRSRSRSPRRRSPPRDAPRGPRGYHQQSGYRSRSRSPDRARNRGRESRGGGYYDRDAPRSRSGSRDREWYGGPASRDVIIEGLGPEMDDEYVVNPPLWTDVPALWA